MDPYLLKYYSDYEFYLNINNKLKGIKLNEIQEKYLYDLLATPYSTSYAMSKKPNEFGIEILNTTLYTKNKIIARQLCKLQLIDHDKIIEEKSLHKRKSYYLTELGIYYIMKRPILFLVDIQSIIKNLPYLKMFEDLLYPFINKDTICSSDFPERISFLIYSYLQKLYLEIEKFILFVEEKSKNGSWEEKRLILNEFKLHNYLIKHYKYKYQWLETAETEQNDDGTIIKFFNIDQPSEYLEVRLREEWILIYLMHETKKIKKPKIKPNKFQIEKYFSREESIGRSFSNYYSSEFKFISSILPALQIIDNKTAMLFLKDKNFIHSLDKTKEKFDEIYKSIKNPSKYSLESRWAGIIREITDNLYFQEQKNLLDNK